VHSIVIGSLRTRVTSHLTSSRPWMFPSMCTTYVLCSILINRHRIVLDPGEITQDVVDNVLDRVQLRTLGVLLRNAREVAFPHVRQIVDAMCVLEDPQFVAMLLL
jgi:hypothetical protein